MEFNSELTENVITSMQNAKTKINNSLANLESIQKNLDLCWISGIEEGYKTKYKDALVKIKAYSQELTKCINYLKNIKEKYEYLEKTNAGLF